METKTLKHVTFVLPSLTAGGAERILINLMLSLDKSKYQTTLITCMDHPGLEHLLSQDISHIRLKATSVLKSMIPLRVTLCRLKPCVVISTMAHMNLATLLCSPPNTPVIVREAILPSFHFKTHPFLSSFLKMAYRSLYSKAFMVISPSKQIENELCTLMHKHNWAKRILLNFIDLDQIRELIEEAGIKIECGEQKKLQLVASGRLHPQKGFERLIRALSISNFSHEWMLNIYGEGTQRVFLQKLIYELGLERKIFLRGHLKDPWVQYASADIFLLPSLSEGLPNVALESLACGTPVLAMAEAGGISEIALQAKEGAVTVANTMQEFMEHLSRTPKQHKQKIGQNLLPECYFKTIIIREFEQILEAVPNNKT